MTVGVREGTNLHSPQIFFYELRKKVYFHNYYTNFETKSVLAGFFWRYAHDSCKKILQ